MLMPAFNDSTASKINEKQVLAMSCDIEINENMQNARTVSNPAGCFWHVSSNEN